MIFYLSVDVVFLLSIGGGIGGGGRKREGEDPKDGTKTAEVEGEEALNIKFSLKF